MANAAPAWRNRIVGHGEVAPDQLLANPKNWRIHPKYQQDALAGVLDEVGFVQSLIVNQRSGFVIDGHARAAMAISKRQPTVPVVYVDLDDAEERLVLATLDPISALAGADNDQLAALLADLEPADAAVASLLRDLLEPRSEAPVATPGPSLSERFLVPPFSVLDARQGYWQERKREWLALGIQSELGRGDQPRSSTSAAPGLEPTYREIASKTNATPGGSTLPPAALGTNGKTVRGDGHGRRLAETYATGVARGTEGGMVQGMVRRAADSRSIKDHEWQAAHLARPQAVVQTDGDGVAAQSGTSIFDPVLCEVVYRWFVPPSGAVLDPMAGGSVRGIIASKLGRSYTGIELRPEQVAANEAQRAIASDPQPVWITGDGKDCAQLAPGQYDLLFSCPPYADLERYSDDPRDLSTMPYEAFLVAYRAIIAASVSLLRPDRFACFVVGDIRDDRGLYRGLISDTIQAFAAAGAALYNEAILVTAVGSLPIRVGRSFSSARKLGKTHQNVLVFVKGDPRKATEACGPVEVAVPDESDGASD